jgi:hypothetical protein
VLNQQQQVALVIRYFGHKDGREDEKLSYRVLHQDRELLSLLQATTSMDLFSFVEDLQQVLIDSDPIFDAQHHGTSVVIHPVRQLQGLHLQSIDSALLEGLNGTVGAFSLNQP